MWSSLDFFPCPTRADYLIPLIILLCNLLPYPPTADSCFLFCDSGSRDPPPSPGFCFKCVCETGNWNGSCSTAPVTCTALLLPSQLDRTKNKQRFPPLPRMPSPSQINISAFSLCSGEERYCLDGTWIWQTASGVGRGSAPWWALSWRSLVCVWLITWNSFDVCIQRVRYPLL